MAKNIGKRTLAVSGQFEPQKVVLRCQPDERSLSRRSSRMSSDAYTQGNLEAAMDVWLSATKRRDALYTSLFRELLTYMMEDPAQHLLLHASALLRQECGTYRRPHHQYRGDGALPRQGRTADGRAPEEGSHLPRACRTYGQVSCAYPLPRMKQPAAPVRAAA